MSPNLFSPAAMAAAGRVPPVGGVRRVDAAGPGHGNGERPGSATGDSRFADALREATAQRESGPALAADDVGNTADGQPDGPQSQAAEPTAAGLPPGASPAGTASTSGPALAAGAAPSGAQTDAATEAVGARARGDVPVSPTVLPGTDRKALNAADRPASDATDAIDAIDTAASGDATALPSAAALAGAPASLAAGRRDGLEPGGDAPSKASWSADPAKVEALDERWPGRTPVKAPPGASAANRATDVADGPMQPASGSAGSVPLEGALTAADDRAADAGGQGPRDAASRPPAEAAQAGASTPPALAPDADRPPFAAQAAQAAQASAGRRTLRGSGATPGAEPRDPSLATGRPQGVAPDGVPAGAAGDAGAAVETRDPRATGARPPAPARASATATPDAATLARTAPAQRQGAGAASVAGAAPVQAGPALPVAGAETLSWAGAFAATATPPAAGAQAAAPVAELRLPLPPGQPGFAAAVGGQVSVMVRDGVQTARLHLHPAELGPITVQIALEGRAAQVHLAAEHALTRQALEQAMPTLAGSLRDSGLTLTGGGVFEQPRDGAAQTGAQPGSAGGNGGGRDLRGDDTRGRALAGTEDRPALTAALPRHRGVVDLVA